MSSDPLRDAQHRLEQKRRAEGILLREAPKPAEPPARDGDPNPETWDKIDDAIDEIGKLEQDRRNYRATLVPDGAKLVSTYKSVARGRVAKGAFKWLALFEIVECDAAPAAVGRVILRSWNEPRRGWLSPKHALARDFAAVCRCSLRSLPPNASPNVILSSFLRDVWIFATAHTVTEFVDAKTRQKVTREPWEHYSVIASIDGVAAGSPQQPRYLSRRRRGVARPRNAAVEAKLAALMEDLSQ